MTTALRVLAAHPSPDGYGADLMFREAVLGLVERGAQVTVTVPGPGPLVDRFRDDGVAIEALDVPVLRKALLTPLALLRLAVRCVPALVRSTRLIRRVQPDVVYVNTVTVPLWLLAARLARCASVCHVREAEDGLSRSLERVLTAPLLLAPHLIANSTHTARRLREAWGRLGPRTVVVYNGFSPAVGEPRPVRQPPTVVVVVGRLSPRKGQLVAIAALDRLVAAGHDVVLRLAGTEYPGYEWYVEEIRAAARSRGLGERVVLEGYVEDTPAVYASSDIVVVPSIVEPFGNVAVEAQLAHRPVVVSATGGLSEIVDDGVTGLVIRPDAPSELADAIATLIDDSELADRLAAAAQRAASERFGLARYRAELFEALDHAAVGDHGTVASRAPKG